MKHSEIKKCLECCIKDDCDNCLNTFGNCEHNLMSDTLAYINQLEDENQKYRETVGEIIIKDDEVIGFLVGKEVKYIPEELAAQFQIMAEHRAKTEGIKEFANNVYNIIDPLLNRFSKSKLGESKAICQVLRGLRNAIYHLAKNIIKE